MLTPRVQFNTQIFQSAKRAVRLRLRPALSDAGSMRLQMTRFQSGDAIGVAYDAPELLTTTGHARLMYHCDLKSWKLNLVWKAGTTLAAANRGQSSVCGRVVVCLACVSLLHIRRSVSEHFYLRNGKDIGAFDRATGAVEELGEVPRLTVRVHPTQPHSLASSAHSLRHTEVETALRALPALSTVPRELIALIVEYCSGLLPPVTTLCLRPRNAAHRLFVVRFTAGAVVRRRGCAVRSLCVCRTAVGSVAPGTD